MKKLSIMILCLIFALIGCSTKQQIPDGLSEDFYNDMLEANELIEKSIATRYDYLNEDFIDKIALYDSLVYGEAEYNDNADEKLTSKEQHIVKLLLDIGLNVGMYCLSFDTRHDISYDDFTADLLNKIQEQHKQFKILLEIEEP